MTQALSQPSPQDLVLLCALAGPLTPSELGAWARLAQEQAQRGELCLLRGGYIPTKSFRLTELRDKLSPELCALAQDLEEKRQAKPATGLEQLRGRARQALVLGQNDLFLIHYSAYGGGNQGGWHPDRDRKQFWYELLGEDLLDSDQVPAGAARNELLHQIQQRYCFDDLPPQLGLPTPPYDESSRINAAIYAHRMGDEEQLALLYEQNPNDKLLQAIYLNYQGRYKEAQPLFKSSLGISAHGALVLSERRWDTAIPIAIKNAFAAKAGAAIIKCWTNYVEQCLCDEGDGAGVNKAIAAAKAGLKCLLEEAQNQQTTETRPAAVIDTTQHQAIFWDLRLSPTGRDIDGIEARLLPPTKEGQQVGKLLALSKLTARQYDKLCDTSDLQLIEHIQEGKWSYLPAWHLASNGYAALSQHPRVRLIHLDGTRRPMRLQIKKASSDKENYQLQEQNDGSFAIYLPEQQDVAGGLHAQVQFRAQELNLSLQGSNEECEEYLQAHGVLNTGIQQSTYSWRYLQVEDALTVLQELQESGITLLWQGSSPLNIHPPVAQGISLSHVGKMGEWLKLGAELKINEQLTFDMEELLELWNKREGKFIPLSDELYLPLHAEQMEQLATLNVATKRKGTQRVAPRAALARISKAWQKDEELSPDFAESLQAFRHQMQTKPELPSSIKATLRPYQRAGFDWLFTRAQCGLGCCLADEMGLGKTLQVLCLLQAQVHAGTSLIIAPLSLLKNWAQEAAKFTPELKIALYQTKKEIPACDVLIASYGQLLAQPQDFEQRWNVLVLDEAQALKNPRAQRSKVVADIKAHSRVALSATPIENNMLELWSLMNILNPHLLGSQRSFKQNAQDASSRHALRELIAPTILRRCKADVMQELPPLTEISVGVELDEAERALYESHRRQTLEILQSNDKDKDFSVLRQLTLLRRLCCHASLVAAGFEQSSKINKLVELARDLQEAGHRALIFSQFTDVLQLAKTALEKNLKAQCLYLDGQLNAKQRNELVERFQEPDAEDFLLISLKAGGTGLNLTAADYVILLDPWWNPAIEQQAMGRAHRMGQQKAVTLCRLICHDTVEEKVLAMHQDKKELAELIEELPNREIENLIN